MTIKVTLADKDYLKDCKTALSHLVEVLVTFVPHTLGKKFIQD